MSARPEALASAASRRVAQVVRGQPTQDGAGVKLTRVIGQRALDSLDPFLLLDEFRSDHAGDYIAGFPEHPHRGFETVTYMLAGHMRHRDNKGNQGDLGPGSVQWMTAGRGIVHSEMPQQENGLLWGFQLWVNLPAADKMTAPRYQDIPADAIPEVSPADGVTVRVIAGALEGVDGPVRAVATDPRYYDIRLAPGTHWRVPLPAGHAAFAYVYDGAASVDGESSTTLARGDLGVLDGDGDAALAADPAHGARLLVVAGQPLREPVARYGPFVMNTREQILEAARDFEAGRF